MANNDKLKEYLKSFEQDTELHQLIGNCSNKLFTAIQSPGLHGTLATQCASTVMTAIVSHFLSKEEIENK